MSTPLDKHGYVMSESDGQSKRYRLILGFASLSDLQAAHEYVVKRCNCQSPTSEGYSAQETPPAPPFECICPKCGLRHGVAQSDPPSF